MQILDSTLREGELFQIFPRESRVAIASKLAESGVKRIELTVDYPPRTTAEDLTGIISVLNEQGVEVILHGRALEEDVEAIAKYPVHGCGLYIAVSKLHRDHKLHGISEDQALDRLGKSVRAAKERGFNYIRATLEDASRLFLDDRDSFIDSLGGRIDALRESGATLISLPDTSGLLSPSLSTEFFRIVKQASSLPVAAHFHNDYGLASANAIQAALEGAEEVHATVMGIGDRNGISDLYEVVATLEDVHGVRTGVKRGSLRELYDYFAKVTGIPLPWRHPLSAEARTVRAGVHQSMTVKKNDGYIPLSKLTNDFGEPLYAVSAYISHNLVQAILNPHIANVDPRTSRRVAELLASSSAVSGAGSRLDSIQTIIRQETGVEIPRQELTRFFGGERLYLLLKLHPQFPAARIVKELLEWDGIEAVDEVYGDADMIVKAHTEYGKPNVVTMIRQKYADALLDLRVLVTD
ncbi:MAG: hypothetical protein OK422_01190 [Thaumarchaeota archaeon]|nr:hypothetical protein [Nitrososphaerota archaeon]